MSDDRPTVHFDHHAPEFARDPWSVYEDLRARCPVAYSEAYGGFWVLTKYEDIKQVALDDYTFSSAESIVIPPKLIPHRAVPIEVDPPLFYEYRRILNPFFSVGAIEVMEPAIRSFVHACIDAFIEKGSCDVVHDLADPLPAMTTLHMLGLPVETWRSYSETLHSIVFFRQDNPIRKKAVVSYKQLREKVMEEIRARRESPRGDMISKLLAAEVQGRPITDEEVFEMVDLTLSGGLDTTGSGISNALIYLDRNLAARDRLRSDPGLLPDAVEEFLRYEAPQLGLARTATRDCEIGGRTIRKGERLFLVWASGNRDEAVFPEPDEVVFDRSPNRHMTFGLGAHRCLGSNVARTQMRFALEAVLERLPDYRVEHDKVVRAETIGTVYGYFSVPISFAPGPRRTLDGAALTSPRAEA